MFRLTRILVIALLATGSASSQPPGDPLQRMQQAIVAGQFIKIGSVLVEQDGKTLYEHYFDGDASNLRDTRSATKSITSILIGIAIDQHRIAGVSTPILSILKPKLQGRRSFSSI